MKRIKIKKGEIVENEFSEDKSCPIIEEETSIEEDNKMASKEIIISLFIISVLFSILIWLGSCQKFLTP